MPSISLRQLAEKIGLSHTTVSEALRDSPRVKPETRARVLKMAKELGYKRNPLAGALMSEMRRSQAGTFRGVLALIDMDGAEGRPEGAARYHRELTLGASRRAQELGFKAEPFSMAAGGLSLKRMETILRSRGIRGVFILPVRDRPDFSRFEWTDFSGIYADYVIERPGLNAVCPDHYRAMLTALDRLAAMGYRRPGLVLDAAHDARLLHRWESAYHAYLSHHGGGGALVPLVEPAPGEKSFRAWFRKVKCDVVLAHVPEVLDWMQAAGADVPRTHGFCCLNVMNCTRPCAGLDLQPRLLGARGIELLIGQVLRNECGVPDLPLTTTVPAAWVDGPTLRAH